MHQLQSLVFLQMKQQEGDCCQHRGRWAFSPQEDTADGTLWETFFPFLLYSESTEALHGTLGKVFCLNLKLSSACGALEAALLQSLNSISSAGIVLAYTKKRCVDNKQKPKPWQGMATPSKQVQVFGRMPQLLAGMGWCPALSQVAQGLVPHEEEPVKCGTGHRTCSQHQGGGFGHTH